jgi:UDP-glucose 4-epimerase
VGSSLRGQRVLLTGARGFVGHHLSAALRAAGAEVHATSRSRRDQDADGVRWWPVDMESPEAVTGAIATVKPDLVYHLSGLARGGGALALALPTFYSLLASTVNLLTAVTATGCRRVVLIGSLDEPIGDAAEVVPRSPYGAAKWAASAYGRMFHHLYATPVTVARVFMMYGPHQAEDKVIPQSIRSLLDGRVPRLWSAERRLDWIFADDAVEGLLRVASAPDLEGATVEIGSGVATSVREVVTELAGLVDPPIARIFDPIPDAPSDPARVADIATAERLLGFRARTPLRDGLARTVDWYRRVRGDRALSQSGELRAPDPDPGVSGDHPRSESGSLPP